MERDPDRPLHSDLLNLPFPSRPLPQIWLDVLEDGTELFVIPGQEPIDAGATFTYRTKKKDPINRLMRTINSMTMKQIRSTYV